MENKKHNLPKRLFIGKTKASQEAKVPIARGGKGYVFTNWADIRWTPAKLSIVSTLILGPITFGIIVSFKAGNSLISVILIIALALMGLMYLAVRYIDRNEF